MKARQTKKDLMREVKELKLRLQEAEEVMQAIRGGEIDGLLVTTPEGERVYTLEGAELPYRIFVEEMSKGAITLTHDGIILYCNPFFARMLHLPQEKLVQKSVQRFVHPSDRDTFDALCEKGKQMESEGEVLLKNNIPVHISLRPLPIYDASPVICGVLTDLRQQKKYQKTFDALNRSRAIFNQAIDAIIICDEQGIITQASPEAKRYCRTRIRGLNFDAVFKLKFDAGPPLQEELFSVSDVLEGRIFRKQEAVLSDGANAFHFLLSARRLFCKKHEVLGCVVTLTDITERRQIEEALRRNEERMRMAWKATRDVIWDWDIVNDLQRWSSAGVEVFGWTDAVEVPQTAAWWMERVHPDDRQRVVEGFHRVLADASRNQWQDEYCFLRKDGTVANVLDRGFVLRDGEGKPTRMIGAMLDITDIMKTRQELARTRNMLAESQKIAHLGSFEYIAATRTTVWSEEEYRIYGLDPAGPSPTYDVMLAKCIHHNDAALLHDTFTKAMQNRSVYELEHRIVRPDGSVRWVYDRAHPHFDEDGNLLSYIGATLDITGRKQVEEALQERQKDLDRAQQVGQIGSWRLDVRHNVLTWSDENHRIFGVPLGAPLTYETFLGIVHPDDRQYVDTRWKAALAGEPYDIEHRILADGRVKWVREKAYLEYDEAGRLMGGFGITQDITDRKRMEEALRESEERFRQVAESLPQLVWTCAADGPCDYLSPQWQRYTGKNEAEQLGYGWLEQLHPDDRERVIAQWRSTAARGENFEIAFRIRRHDGTYRWFRTLAVPLRDEAGRIVRWFGSNTDIDEITRAEVALHQRTAELEQLSATLEHRVLERTEELMALNQQLQKSQDRLRRLSQDLLNAQEKERKRVAWELHDSIGSSLTAIKFRIENILRDDVADDSQTATALKKVIPVVQTAVMEAKRIQMNLRPSMLDDLGIVATARWFFNQFRETYPEVQLEQHIKIEEDDVPTSLKTVIFRIFQEGLNNAARHSNSPVVSLYLWKSNRTLKLIIRDRGQGFDLSEVQSRTGHNRGLGLESMKERAELSGGCFSVATRKGKGTVVRVSWSINSKS